MVEEDVQSFLCVVDLCFEGCRGFRFHALHVVVEDFVNGSGFGWDVAPVSRGWTI